MKGREENHRLALRLLFGELRDDAYDVKLFRSAEPTFGAIQRTTWEGLLRDGSVTTVRQEEYRLTAKGWLACLELMEAARSQLFMDRLSHLLATMKKHVKPRLNAQILPLSQIAQESGEPEGWIFNVIDSRASSTAGRMGARWVERGRLVEIPVDFNITPIDIAAGLTVGHLEKIEELEARLAEVKQDRAHFHCPDCDAPIVRIGEQDFPEYHCIVTYEHFGCGLVLADGGEESPCPFGPRWPKPEEFELLTNCESGIWTCLAHGKTLRAMRISVTPEYGHTKAEAEGKMTKVLSPRRNAP
jgi:hypothetical protein